MFRVLYLQSALSCRARRHARDAVQPPHAQEAQAVGSATPARDAQVLARPEEGADPRVENTYRSFYTGDKHLAYVNIAKVPHHTQWGHVRWDQYPCKI